MGHSPERVLIYPISNRKICKNEKEAVTSAASREPQGLKPGCSLPLHAALKGRSSTPSRSSEDPVLARRLGRTLGFAFAGQPKGLSLRERCKTYAALPGPLPSKTPFSEPMFTLICFGLASAFLGSVIFNTPLS
jgi:hypothetical protein